MSCKEGDFVSIRHNGLRDLTAKMLSEVCKDTEIEPKLTPLTSEELVNRTANTTNVARLDITARGVWDRGQYAYLDLRLFDISACLYLTSCSMHEQEKKRAYNKSVFQVEYVTFISFFFRFMEVWGRNATRFIQDHSIYYLKNVIYRNR